MQADMFADQHIINGSHVGKQADILKRAGNAQGSDLEWFEPADVLAIKDHFDRL